MKKYLLLLMTIALVLSMTACGKVESADSANTDQSVEVTDAIETEIVPEDGAKLLVWESPGVEAEFMREVAESFSQKYGIEVTVQEVDGIDSTTKLSQDGPAGVGADVFAASHDQTGKLVMSGLVLPNAFSDDIEEEMIEASIKAVTYDGVLYGYPRAIETYGMFYNKDIFKEAPKTFDEIIEFGKTFTNEKENKYAFMMDVDGVYFVQAFIGAEGGYVFGKDGTDPNDVGIDSAGAIEGMKEFLKLKEILPLSSGDADYNVMMGLFNEGKVGAIITGPWEYENIKNSGLNYGLAKIPTLSNGKVAMPFSGVRGLFVSAYSEYPNAAQLFAKYYCEVENLTKRYEVTNQIPTFKGASEMPSIIENPDVAVIAEQAKESVPMPSIPEMQLVWGPLGTAYSAIWDGTISIEDGLKNAAEQVKSDIASQ